MHRGVYRETSPIHVGVHRETSPIHVGEHRDPSLIHKSVYRETSLIHGVQALRSAKIAATATASRPEINLQMM